jgi:glycine/D-amino acid oxidase-like deaminating enzyme/nitrite reductase/ring-hydroxylating ferredoxin subunit
METLSTASLWQEATSLPAFRPLDRDLRVDVVVIGGGVTGITAAYLLAARGRSVALVERDRVLSHDTSRTTAHLTCVTDMRLAELVRTLGRDHAGAVWDAGLAALALIDDHCRIEGIDCGFAWVPGYLHAPVSAVSDEAASLRDEAALAFELGFDAEYVERGPLGGIPAMRLENQARIHPLRYLEGLLRAAISHGCQVFEQSKVREVTDNPTGVSANGHVISCDDVVIATHNPIVGRQGMAAATLLQTKLALYTSYVIAGRVARDAIEDALYWDTADPYHYLRLEPRDDHDVVIFGGEDHKTGQEPDTPSRFARLEAALRELVPGVAITHHWSGQVIETHDGLPFIGASAPHEFLATGYAGNGMTFGTLAAMIAADLVAGVRNPWRELFDPGRSGVRGGIWDYLKENADYPYYMVRDRFAGPKGRSLRGVPRGEGRVLDVDGERVAAYRAPDGSMLLRSAVCTHMGCVVNWNGAERSWDCPCHGSRFTPAGEVIAGPASSPLEAIVTRPSASQTAPAN